MKILSTSLPKLDSYAKDLVNNGIIYLYQAKSKNSEYLLKVDDTFYLLSQDGEVINSSTSKPSDIKISDMVCFSDLAFPPSLNMLLCR